MSDVFDRWVTEQANLKMDTVKELYPIKPIAKCDRKRMPCKMRILDNHKIDVHEQCISVLSMRVDKIHRSSISSFAFVDAIGNCVARVKVGYPVTGARMSDAVHQTVEQLEYRGMIVPTSAMGEVAKALRAYEGLYSYGPSAETGKIR